MQRTFTLIFLCWMALGHLSAQSKIGHDYYLPLVSYDPKVPSPEQFLGYQIGERHISHDELAAYMRELARTSSRVRLQEYGRSHEGRPLLCLTFAKNDWVNQLEVLKNKRRALADPQSSGSLQPADFPAVVYMGYSIHGNETSGSNAAMLVGYWLAAAQGAQIDETLDHTIVLFDPCFNPDGLQRFSSWVNSRRSTQQNPDPNSDEFNEHWPGGRFNHYWFDLNRDWLVMQQPESEGRVRIFQDWLPNVLTDHHEMGTNSTFFFQPGVPSRVNPITPAANQQLTAKMATYHAAALSLRGIPFFTAENFDDFYYGKGSTYPDANGSVGILFEQASSRGTAQDSENGPLTFAYSIRNQVFTSFSTLKAVGEMRNEMNQYLRDFYTESIKEAQKSPVKGYWVHNDGSAAFEEFRKRILAIHRVEYQTSLTNTTVEGQVFSAGSLYIPFVQPRYRVIRAIFDRTQQFQDSIFYDISAWTLPDAFGLQWSGTNQVPPSSSLSKVLPVSQNDDPGNGLSPDPPIYAYLFYPQKGQQHLVKLLREGYRVKVATAPFKAEGKEFPIGTMMVLYDRQKAKLMALKEFDPILLYNGLTDEGPDLGSSSFAVCRLPKVLLVTGDGVNPLDAGEIWHYLDTRMGLPPTLMETHRLSSDRLAKYQVVILPDGNYDDQLPVEALREFVDNGGTLIGTGRALQWLKKSGIAKVEMRPVPTARDQSGRRPYAQRGDDSGARTMPGSIFEAEIDPTHPICFGFNRKTLPVFLGDALYPEPTDNPYNTPLMLSKKPLISGYQHPEQRKLAEGAGVVTVHTSGQGRVVAFAINANFRGFWRGTEQLMGNAVLYGHLIK
jgi:Zinc carboxypeptidase